MANSTQQEVPYTWKYDNEILCFWLSRKWDEETSNIFDVALTLKLTLLEALKQ